MAAEVAQIIRLHQNRPNPFNNSTIISYEVWRQAYVKLSVYNLLNQEIAILLAEVKPTGLYTVPWNGHNRYGNPVASGVYWVRLETGQYSCEAGRSPLRIHP